MRACPRSLSALRVARFPQQGASSSPKSPNGSGRGDAYTWHLGAFLNERADFILLIRGGLGLDHGWQLDLHEGPAPPAVDGTAIGSATQAADGFRLRQRHLGLLVAGRAEESPSQRASPRAARTGFLPFFAVPDTAIFRGPKTSLTAHRPRTRASISCRVL